MEYNKMTLHDGLHLMYLGELIGLVGLIVGLGVLLIPGLGLLGLFIILSALVGVVMSIVGLFKLRNEHSDYMIALIILAVSFVCGLISKNSSGLLSTVFDLANSVLGLAKLYYVIRTTNMFLSQIGREDLVEKGRKALFVQAASTVVAVLVDGLSLVMRDSIGALVVLLIVIAVVAIIAAWFYLNYLKESSEALR